MNELVCLKFLHEFWQRQEAHHSAPPTPPSCACVVVESSNLSPKFTCFDQYRQTRLLSTNGVVPGLSAIRKLKHRGCCATSMDVRLKAGPTPSAPSSETSQNFLFLLPVVI